MDIHVETGRPRPWDKSLMIQAFPPQPPEQLRRQAEIYRRMARSVRDGAAAARFEAWADECDARAEGKGTE
jgi:hypothetical protein